MKAFKSVCGAMVTEAHYHRNIVREMMEENPVAGLLAKDKTLDAEGKAARLYQARAFLLKAVDHLTTALASTSEGRALLVENAPVEFPETEIEALQHNTDASEVSETPYVRTPGVTPDLLAELFAQKSVSRAKVGADTF
jgi:hypothetical protein